MASSAAAQIEADAGKTLRTVVNGKDLPDYATIFGILLGVIIAWLLIWTFLGPDADGALFEQAKIATQDGAGNTIAGERALRHSVSAPHKDARAGNGSNGGIATPKGEHYEEKREIV